MENKEAEAVQQIQTNIPKKHLQDRLTLTIFWQVGNSSKEAAVVEPAALQTCFCSIFIMSKQQLWVTAQAWLYSMQDNLADLKRSASE